eukprot:scaffold253161_cov23-Tisochrysis_lutea.AAC.4
MSIKSRTRSTCVLYQSCHAKSGPAQWPCDSHIVSGRLVPSSSSARARWWRVSQRPQSTTPRCLVTSAEERSSRAECTRGSSLGSRKASREEDEGRESSLIDAFQRARCSVWSALPAAASPPSAAARRLGARMSSARRYTRVRVCGM